MPNETAVEKLIENLADIILKDGASALTLYGAAVVSEIVITAIQSDPMAYVKPKPLLFELVGTPPTYVSTISDYGIQEGVECGKTVWVLDEHDEFLSEHLTLEAAQAAAYEDLCKRVKELFLMKPNQGKETQ